jgi:formylglycine-generating enzyme required for sulfatase activity
MKTRMVLVLVAAAVNAAPPRPVTDLHIQLTDSAHVQLDWTPVDEDIEGQPLPRVIYDVHRGGTPDFMVGELSRLDSTSAAQYRDSLVDGRAFYRVKVRSCDAAEPEELLRIPAGTLIMGDNDLFAAAPAHEVHLTRDYLLGRCEVSNDQFLVALNWALGQGMVTVVGDFVQQHGVNLLRIHESGVDCQEIRFNAESQQFELHAGTFSSGVWGPGFAYPTGYDPADHPVKYVTWYGAACYCDWRSQMEGLPAYYNGNWAQIPDDRDPYVALSYRLPTEAEWEHAARHLDGRSFPWGAESPACSLANHSGGTFCVGWSRPVGSLPDGASTLELQDMAGNVAEWCNDWWAAYTEGSQTNPAGPANGSARIMKGGSWFFGPLNLMCANRSDTGPAAAWHNYGFRLCRMIPPETPLEMVIVPAGQFIMGQTGYASPTHQVTLTRDFLLGRTEVTNAQYLEALNWALEQGLLAFWSDYVGQYGTALLRINQSGADACEIVFNQATQLFELHAGSHNTGSWGPGFAYPAGYDPANMPVTNLSWRGAACYCDWLSAMNGLTPYYNGNWEQIPVPDNPYAAEGYRLPTEAEWEYAAQFNDERLYPWGSAFPSCELANLQWNSYCVGWTSPVGEHPAGTSGLGFLDLMGNVAEYCNDRYAAYSSGPQVDPTGPAGGSNRIVRGGGWTDYPSNCVQRLLEYSYSLSSQGGFRVCRTYP